MNVVTGGRRSGRTLAKVQAIPESGTKFVVHSSQMRTYLANMISDVRGKEILDRCRIHIVSSPRDVSRLRGYSGPFEVDHEFWDQVGNRDTKQALLEFLDMK